MPGRKAHQALDSTWLSRRLLPLCRRDAKRRCRARSTGTTLALTHARITRAKSHAQYAHRLAHGSVGAAWATQVMWVPIAAPTPKVTPAAIAPSTSWRNPPYHQ